jgi:hypothetical protein
MKEEELLLKRDMEFVRKLLIDFSEGKSQMQFTTSTFENENQNHADDRKYEYHMKIMQQHDLITYKAAAYKGGFTLLNVPELTWNGQDYLSAIEDETIWNKTKEGLATKGLELGKIAFDTLLEFAKMKAKEKLGIQ